VRDALADLYGGQPSFRTMVDLLGDLGFEAIDLHPSFCASSDGRVLQLDATFARTE
jgi:hypothetical protein